MTRAKRRSVTTTRLIHSLLPIALILGACSAPDYYEISPHYSQGELVHRGGSLDSDSTGLMFTMGWNLQAETHHRETMMEMIRGDAPSTYLIDHPEQVQAPPPPAPEGGGGLPSTALYGGLAAILGAVALLIRSVANKGGGSDVG